jgi:hypothetical protein
MYVETDIVTSILVSLSGQMYVETDIVTSILGSLTRQMYGLNIHFSWQTH